MYFKLFLTKQILRPDIQEHPQCYSTYFSKNLVRMNYKQMEAGHFLLLTFCGLLQTQWSTDYHNKNYSTDNFQMMEE